MSRKQDDGEGRQDRTRTGAARRLSEDPAPVAVEFIHTLHELGVVTLSDWLKANDVPQEVLALMDCIVALGDYANGGPVVEADMGQTVVQTVNAIAALGGRFYGPESATEPRRRWK